MTDIQTQANNEREKISEIFDKALESLVGRKKILEESIEMAFRQYNEKLTQRIKDLQMSAKQLLAVMSLCV